MSTHALTSWTRTLNPDDALLLLELAQPGLSLDDWAAQAHDRLPQAGRPRRTELIRLTRERLLDVDGERVADTAYLRMIHDGTPARRDTLLHGRALFDHPWIAVALDEIVHPQLEAADRPLAPRDVDRVTDGAWAALLDRHLKPGTGPQSVDKTRSQIQRNLARLGVLELRGNTARDTYVRRGQPDAVAFAWLVAHELRVANLPECDAAWAARQSRAARLFAVPPLTADTCIEAGVRAGVLRSGFLAGRPRLHPGTP